jgi:alpha-galactosidase
MNRRNFIRTTGLSLASILISERFIVSGRLVEKQIIDFPDGVTATANGEVYDLKKSGDNSWNFHNISVNLKNDTGVLAIKVRAPGVRLSAITLQWKTSSGNGRKILNDQWERTYGDVLWHRPYNSEILPWYFIEYNDKKTTGFGVRTGSNSFCFWEINDGRLSLTLDTRSGGNGVELGNRELLAAEVVTMISNQDESPFKALQRFTTIMCDKAHMPAHHVYGINDWYFSYGNNSEKLIMQHTEMMAPMADGLENRPFSLIDAGWFEWAPSLVNDGGWGDNMNTPNSKFSDMGNLALKIRKMGMRPGIWTRPLCGSYKDPKNLMLPLIKGREINKPVLDPSIPENIERVKSYFQLYNNWSFEIVKFDYTSFDIFGRWGFDMIKNRSMSEINWSMYDKSRTNAEIVLDLYRAIRDAAGATYLIACNTFSHLAAGLFELNRIGDDTSGNEWARTRKMGVNTLAFRGAQHGSFYCADPDCVGLTPKIPWDKNRQWMELVAKSGTPLFISAQSEAVGAPQKEAIKNSFRYASQTLPLGEPLDWMENPFPEKWKLNGEVVRFNWD